MPLLKNSFAHDDELALAASVQEGLRLMRQSTFDAVFYQTDSQDEEGVVLCRRLCREGAGWLVLMAPGGEHDRVLRGLYLGADAYVNPEGDAREVSARIRALLRRMNASA